MLSMVVYGASAKSCLFDVDSSLAPADGRDMSEADVSNLSDVSYGSDEGASILWDIIPQLRD